MEMDESKLPPHVLIFPLPLQGPVNSMFKLAELLCLSNIHITFLVTEYIHHRLLKYTDIQSKFKSYPGFQLKTIPDGLPEEHPRFGDKFMDMLDSLRNNTKPVFKDMLISGGFVDDSGGRRRPVSCIIADGILGFTCDVANETGIPIYYVRTVSPCCLWVFFCLPQLIDSGEIPFEAARCISIPFPKSLKPSSNKMNRKKRGKVSAGHGRIKLQLEEMDRANAISRRLSGYRQGTPVDRARSAVTNWLRKEWKESMIDFQKMVHTQAILIVMLASFTGFGGAMCGTTVIYELMKLWRNRRSLSAQPNTSQEAIRPVQTSDNNQTPQLDPEQQNGSTGIGRGS